MMRGVVRYDLKRDNLVLLTLFSLKYMEHFFTKVIAILLVSASLAQKHKVSGYVFDNETKEPIENVNVTVVGESSGGITDSAGFFQIQMMSTPVRLYFSHLNYGIASTSVSVRGMIDIGIFLAKESTQIEEVQVSAQRIMKMSLGDTLNVIDYAFVGRSRIVLVATPFRNQLDQRFLVAK